MALAVSLHAFRVTLSSLEELRTKRVSNTLDLVHTGDVSNMPLFNSRHSWIMEACLKTIFQPHWACLYSVRKGRKSGSALRSHVAIWLADICENGYFWLCHHLPTLSFLSWRLNHKTWSEATRRFTSCLHGYKLHYILMTFKNPFLDLSHPIKSFH